MRLNRDRNGTKVILWFFRASEYNCLSKNQKKCQRITTDLQSLRSIPLSTICQQHSKPISPGGFVQFVNLFTGEACGLDDIGINIVHGGEVGGHLFEGGRDVVKGGENLCEAADTCAELHHLVIHFAPSGGGGADVPGVFFEVLAQFSDFLGVGDVLVRADGHAVLLVGEAVHFRPYLLDGGFDLLAVDEDGDSSCAALCHSLKFWQSWHKCPSQAGTVRENAVVVFGCVFVFPNTATTIAAVMSTKYEI